MLHLLAFCLVIDVQAREHLKSCLEEAQMSGQLSLFVFYALKGIREGNGYDDQEGRGSEQNMATSYLVRFKVPKVCIGRF